MQRTNKQIAVEQCANSLKTMHQQGISVIPLRGKRPHFSVKWKQYQFALPDETTINEWTQQAFSSYGIICGRVSGGIVVIDFDCTELYTTFQKQFPSLADTYTVRTRRGFHIYTKTSFPVSSRRLTNCDIKGDGSYVVGAGSNVNGHIYDIHKPTNIRPMSYKEYTQLLDWLSLETEQPALQQSNPGSHLDLVTRYCQLANHQGRNNALYVVASEAQHAGIGINQTIETLASKHAFMPATTTNHKHETRAQRFREAVRTIRSAYRPSQQQYNTTIGLPNSIREELLKIQRSAIFARLIDIIRKKHIRGFVTASQLTGIARSIHISKRSVLRLLTGDLAKVNGCRLFKQIPYKDHIESYVSQGDKREPNSRVGRPTQFIYRIPSDDYLYRILRVPKSFSDSLKLEDLRSTAAYRRALHRELIRRLSPMIRINWYASRLGVHRRTIFRYNVRLGVVATPMIHKEVLTAETITRLPENDRLDQNGFTPGIWLETKSGKRYPALQSIANNLVSVIDTVVMICRQLPTRYRLSDCWGQDTYPISLPDHLRSRSKLLTYTNIHDVLSPDWATKKFELGGYLAVYNGYEWTFRPPLRAIAYQLVKQYEEGLVYFIRPLKS